MPSVILLSQPLLLLFLSFIIHLPYNHLHHHPCDIENFSHSFSVASTRVRDFRFFIIIKKSVHTRHIIYCGKLFFMYSTTIHKQCSPIQKCEIHKYSRKRFFKQKKAREKTLFSEWGEKAAKNVARRCYIEKVYNVASLKFICIKIIFLKGLRVCSLKIAWIKKSYANFTENPLRVS